MHGPQSGLLGLPRHPQQALDATTAHEFNHSLQFGYGALNGDNVPDDNFIEGGATWMEDEVFDDANDNYNYLYPEFDDSMGEHDEGDIYAYWLTWRGLTERFGTNGAGLGEQVMQDFWELTSRNAGDNLTAMQQALANKGSTLPTPTTTTRSRRSSWRRAAAATSSVLLRGGGRLRGRSR